MAYLKIADSSPASISILNKWADEKEQLAKQHTDLLAQHAVALKSLQNQLNTLLGK